MATLEHRKNASVTARKMVKPTSLTDTKLGLVRHINTIIMVHDDVRREVLLNIGITRGRTIGAVFRRFALFLLHPLDDTEGLLEHH